MCRTRKKKRARSESILALGQCVKTVRFKPKGGKDLVELIASKQKRNHQRRQERITALNIRLGGLWERPMRSSEIFDRVKACPTRDNHFGQGKKGKGESDEQGEHMRYHTARSFGGTTTGTAGAKECVGNERARKGFLDCQGEKQGYSLERKDEHSEAVEMNPIRATKNTG